MPRVQIADHLHRVDFEAVLLNPSLKFMFSSLMRKVTDIKPCHRYDTSSVFLLAIALPCLERAVSGAVLGRKLQDTSGRDHQTGEAALRFTIQTDSHCGAVLREEIRTYGQRAAAAIDENE